VDVAAHELEGFAVAADGLTRDPVARARVMAPVGGALEGGPGVGRRIARPVGAEIAQGGAHGGVRVGVERGRPGHEFAGGLHGRKARRILEPRELLLERCAPVDVVVVPDLGHVRRVCQGRDRSWAFGETPQPPALAKIVCITNSAGIARLLARDLVIHGHGRASVEIGDLHGLRWRYIDVDDAVPLAWTERERGVDTAPKPATVMTSS
jgi:hypothetical protein